jgi:segregation and condensation protein A
MSPPELELEEEPGPAEPSEPSPEAAVINHLLFHKSLIAEDHDASRLNAYIEMVKAKREGAHLVMVNPFDRAIAIAFQLVIEKHLDPWKLDLVVFTNLYLEHVRQDKEVDLITAGRLIFLAWSVLKLQSDEALLRAEASRHQPEPEPEQVSWDDIPTDAWLTDDGAFAFTNAVLQGPAPIDEKVRHRGDRKVTLFELVEAFEEARQEAETRLVLDARRREAKQLWAKQSKAGVQGAAHKEDLEAEIAEVWGRITKLNGHPIPLRELHRKDRDDLVKCLVSVLFLAREQRINLWQDDFPYGPIFVKNLQPGQHEPEAKQALEALQAQAKPKKARARKAKAKSKALQEIPITSQLQVAAAVAHALARVLPPEVTGDG